MNVFPNLGLSQAVWDTCWGNVQWTEITDHKPSWKEKYVCLLPEITESKKPVLNQELERFQFLKLALF